MHEQPTHRITGRPTRASRWRRAAGLASLVAVAALTLAACTDDDGGGDDTDTEATTTTSTPTSTATSEATTATTTATETESATETATATEGTATGDTTISVATEGDLAPFLVGPEGMTLYMFTNDEDGVSNCVDQCIQNWPPLIVESGETPTASEDAPGELGTIERTDGLGTQVTYDGMPLYYWQGDSAPGDTTGHEVGDVWFVVPPDDSQAAAPISNGPGY